MSANSAPYYFVPGLSAWPILGALSMLLFIIGASNWVNGVAWAPFAFALSLAVLFFVLYGWFKAVVSESQGGQYNQRVDVSFRWSMGWFIFSEVMFFASFFGALFYARQIAMPWLGDLDNKAILWPDFSASWPNTGPAGTVENFTTMGPWPLPTINTALLLTSGVTLTIAHHALLANQRGKLVFNLMLTVLLGVIFMGV
ncbi:MAG: cytochrome c oxidase subunit 3, partial [Limnobacter sp.]|nr:cytochrome c oxidase subunit 3 [Limnobacter sp.]